jgi:hypothetical protein
MTSQPMSLNSDNLLPWIAEFYRRVMNILNESNIPFLVGGGFAFYCYTGIARYTKDFDIFILPSDVDRALNVLSEAGYETENKYPHWLAKVYHHGQVVDVIFSSGNGICQVDADWFKTGTPSKVLGEQVQLIAVEEMIWQKAFIMERHRYDGSDIIHLLHHHRDALNWDRLLRRFRENWLVLMSHLLLYRFVFPDDPSEKINTVLQWLALRVQKELDTDEEPCNGQPALCRGTLLSLLDYLPAVEERGYRDARLRPYGNMTQAEVEHWTNTFER